ncbi:MAG: DUF6519 domain-containing protein [Oculatellaceae cyanobacterium bins.114]|nr:DUF6519 domain-containing protein [Oculatellaceae cyanobacterium bins.114]
MKGDFSRYTFDAAKHYNSVLMQQGRVQLDADWNEQQAIHQHRVETETKDVIGLCGVPETAGGFEIKWIGTPRAMSFVDNQRGWVITTYSTGIGFEGDDGIILKTTDGGQTWIKQNPRIKAAFRDIHFINSTEGWVIAAVKDQGKSLVLRTVDAGEHWTIQRSAVREQLYDVYFIDKQTGWIVGENSSSGRPAGVILGTVDGGQTWNLQKTVTENLFLKIYFANDQIGWAIGTKGLILSTLDGGQTWVSQRSNSQETLQGMHFVSELQGWVVGQSSNSTGFNSIILRTVDGGKTWEIQRTTTQEILLGVYFVNDQKGWAVGATAADSSATGTILETNDSGRNWTVLFSKNERLFSAIYFSNLQRGWLISGIPTEFPKTGGISTTVDGGRSWVPQIHLNDLAISPGRIYVDGILCENEGALYRQQPDLPAAALPETSGIYLAYLDVWKRHITLLDDPLIQEKALGGPDTTTRLKTVWQVKLLPLQVRSEQIKRGLERLLQEVKELSDDQAKIQQVQSLTETLLQQLEQFSREESDSFRAIAELQTRLNSILVEVKTLPRRSSEEIQAIRTTLQENLLDTIDAIPSLFPNSVTCNSPLPEWDALTQQSTGKLNARTTLLNNDDKPCLVPPTAGYQRLENQLYRVEIHRGGTLEEATFKWSRDNGSIATLITEIDGQTLTVQDIGRDDVLGLADGQWAEVIDDIKELHNQPGQLVRINIDPTTNKTAIAAETPLNTTEVNRDYHPKLRRWDQVGSSATQDGVGLSNGWLALEGGIEVQFSEGHYKTGDYWLIPARTATGEIEWPPYKVPNTDPIAQPPLGIEHHYCRLAILSISGEGYKVLQDCRKRFPPLTQISSVAQTAIHVIGISWGNDNVLQLDEDSVFELRITLDAPIQQNIIKRATMIVAMELPIGFEFLYPRPDTTFILDPSQTSVEGNTIRWVSLPRLGLNDSLFPVFLAFLGRIQGYPPEVQPLVRVTLKGHAIWNEVDGRQLFLDGQAFGRPGIRTNGEPCIGLTFPSGHSAKASDFESWFYLTLPTPVAPVRLQSISLNPDVLEGETNTSTVTVSLTGVAPAGGIAVQISTDDSNFIVTIPSVVTVPERQSTVDFQITVINPSQLTGASLSIKITASYEGESRETTLSLIGFRVR